jgi:hypothetical protein
MILAAREAGDLAKQEDGRPEKASTPTTLSDLGISRDLAAYSVQVAKIPDEIWPAGLC